MSRFLVEGRWQINPLLVEFSESHQDGRLIVHFLDGREIIFKAAAAIRMRQRLASVRIGGSPRTPKKR